LQQQLLLLLRLRRWAAGALRCDLCRSAAGAVPQLLDLLPQASVKQRHCLHLLRLLLPLHACALCCCGHTLLVLLQHSTPAQAARL
jgi:hypothetical protein